MQPTGHGRRGERINTLRHETACNARQNIARSSRCKPVRCVCVHNGHTVWFGNNGVWAFQQDDAASHSGRFARRFDLVYF